MFVILTFLLKEIAEIKCLNAVEAENPVSRWHIKGHHQARCPRVVQWRGGLCEAKFSSARYLLHSWKVSNDEK